MTACSQQAAANHVVAFLSAILPVLHRRIICRCRSTSSRYPPCAGNGPPPGIFQIGVVVVRSASPMSAANS
eukprot:1701811-Amphidinium_carterae.1